MSLLKMLLQNILTSEFVYRFITCRFIREGFLKTEYGWINVSGQDMFIQSLIFWRLYERKEIRILKKHIDVNLDCIELGSSIGCVSLCLAFFSGKNGKKIVGVEANPSLMSNLLSSFRRNKYEVVLYNSALSYGERPARLIVDKRNLGSRLTGDLHSDGIIVDAITLRDVFYDNNIGDYMLFSDIEGSEVELFLNEKDGEVIKKCKKIIIELHDTVYEKVFYSKDKIAGLIQDRFGMKKTYSDSQVWVFDKIS